MIVISFDVPTFSPGSNYIGTSCKTFASYIRRKSNNSLKQCDPKVFPFLAVQSSSIGDLVTDWLTHSLSDFWFWHYRVALETCDLWDILSVSWGPDLTTKPTYLLPTYLPICQPTPPQGAILDTCDNWDIWSAVMIWHLGCSLMEQSWGLVTFVTLITILTIENLD